MEIDKICVVCGRKFVAKNNKGIYCSNSCRMIAYRRRNLLYKSQEEDLNELEKTKFVRDFNYGLYQGSENRCKKLQIKIDQLMAERKYLNDLIRELSESKEELQEEV